MSFYASNRRFRSGLALLSAGLGLAFLPQLASAQVPQWDIQGRIGVAVPLGKLADTHDPGVAFGLGLSRWVNSRVAFHLDTGVDLLGGSDAAIPDFTMLHYNAGAEFDLVDPQTSPLRLHALLGAGGTTTQVQDADSNTDFTLDGGLSLEYKFTNLLQGLVGSQLYIVFADETLYELPIQVGLRYFFTD